MDTKIHTAKVFTVGKKAGGPVGVVLKADQLKTNQMQTIAAKSKLSKIAFILPSKKADYKIRAFSPSTELTFSSNASLATAHLYKSIQKKLPKSISQEFNKSIYQINFQEDSSINIQHPLPNYGGFIDTRTVMSLLNLQPHDIIKDAHPEIISTGSRDIIFPLANQQALFNLKPNFKGMAKFNKNTSTIGLLLFTLDVKDGAVTAYTRYLSPAVDVEETTASGTANTSLACYLFKHNLVKQIKTMSFHQFHQKDHSATVFVNLNTESQKITQVWTSGKVLVKKST